MSAETTLRAPRRESDEVEYLHLCHLLDSGDILPFLGAGASLCESSGNESGDNLPTGRQLAKSLASELEVAENELDADDLIEVASCLELCTCRAHLEHELKEVFGRTGRPGPLHRFIATLKPLPSVVVTTNYDTLVEQAFRQEDRAFHLVMTPVKTARERVLMWWGPGESVARVERPERVDIQPSDLPIIYRIHGGLAPNGDWISSIITEDDYFEIGGRIYESSLLPPQIAAALQRSSLLFLGYSLRDIHVRFLIGQSARWSAQRHYLVSKAVSRMDCIRFDRLGVTVIELPIAGFLERLVAARSSYQART